ncbi:hypothetical protein [Actinoplanes xinjiangensis]|uniref:hypothetical protein n=1 Tax=Actinoplanes xinjiangensis TaxID=512350 RepID=UPI00342DE0E1
MTLVVQPSTQVDQPGIVRRRAIGTPEEIKVALDLLARSGTLVSASVPRQVAPGDPRVIVLVRVRDGVPTTHPASRSARRPRWVKPLVISGSILAVLAGLIIGGYFAVRQVVTAASGMPLAAVGFLAVVAVLVLLVGAGRTKGVCMGLHCSGCGHR